MKLQEGGAIKPPEFGTPGPPPGRAGSRRGHSGVRTPRRLLFVIDFGLWELHPVIGFDRIAQPIRRRRTPRPDRLNHPRILLRMQRPWPEFK